MIETNCPKCKGVGWLVSAFGPETGWKTKLVRCNVCGAHRQQEYLQALSGLSPEMLTWTLDGFMGREGRVEAIQAAKAVIANPRWWLILYGPAGTGKTYLMAAIVNALRQQGYMAIYTTMADLLDHCRQAYDPAGKGPDYDDFWSIVVNAHCLAIDEIEKFRPTPWAEEKVFQLMDERYRNAPRQLTVLATNSTVRRGVQLLAETRYPGYLESRILDGRNRIVHLACGDVRPAM